MTGFFEVLCPVCGEEIPETGFRRRRIPWKSGRKMRVHEHCAAAVETQEVLTDHGKPIGEKPRRAAA